MLIKKYTTNWIKDFEDIKHEIEHGLGQLSFTIEHVGSTAVPNLDAKPIIDIDIIYPNQTNFEPIKTALEKIGYYHNGNQGIEDRDVFKRNNTVRHQVLDAIQHHLYVCPAHSKALERHILSRNALRKQEWARVKYQEMKYALAEKANQDKKTYADLKEITVNDFIDALVEEEKRQQYDIR